MHITPQYAGGDVGNLSKVLMNNDVDVLSIQDGATCEGGMSGVTYSRECMVIFSNNWLSGFLLGDAHEDGVSFDSVDSYVWNAIEKYAEEILNDWAALEYIVKCSVCDRWEYAKDAYEHNDEHVCSRECLAGVENAEEKDDE